MFLSLRFEEEIQLEMDIKFVLSDKALDDEWI